MPPGRAAAARPPVDCSTRHEAGWPGSGSVPWRPARSACGRRRQVGDVQVDVAGDVEIEPAVAVVVAEGAAREPAVDCHAGLRRDIAETAAAVHDRGG